jgi:hypothetical protein
MPTHVTAASSAAGQNAGELSKMQFLTAAHIFADAIRLRQNSSSCSCDYMHINV